MAALAMAAVVIACRATPAPPDGFEYPTHSVGGDAPTALLQGTLQEEGGCLYVQPTEGPRYFVVWPDTSYLAIQDSVPTIMSDGMPYGQVGGEVRVGGGEASSMEARPPSRCAGPVWMGYSLEPFAR